MTTMRAAVLREFEQPFVVEELELLDLDPTRVLIQTKAAPFCSTDVTSFHGKLGKAPPTILGHAAVGEVMEVGSEVRGSPLVSGSWCRAPPNAASASTAGSAVRTNVRSCSNSAASTPRLPATPRDRR